MAESPRPIDDDSAVPHPSRPSLLTRTSAARIARADSSASSTTSTSASSQLQYPNASNALFGNPGYLPGVAQPASERVYPHSTESKFHGRPSPRSPNASSTGVDEAVWLKEPQWSGYSEELPMGPQTDSLRLASKVVAPSSEFLLKTARFKHATVDGNNLVLTGPAGELIRCEDEVRADVGEAVYLDPLRWQQCS